MTTWQQLATQLATSMPATVSPTWRQAIATTPRHNFVPAEFITGHDTAPGDTPAPLTKAYQDARLFPAAQPSPHSIAHLRPPSVVASLIEALDVRPGHRVLEIGLDHGYSTALLARVLGDDATFAIDPDPAAVHNARARLADIGHRPHLAIGHELPEHGPYDRILVTDDIARVPWELAEQLAPGGLISVDISLGRTSGGRVVLRREADRLSGHFSPAGRATAPTSRRLLPRPRHPAKTRDRTNAEESSTTLDPRLWNVDPLWLMFLASTRRRDIAVGLIEDDDGDRYYLSDNDGSWAEIERVDQERRRTRETRPDVIQPPPSVPPHTGARRVWQAGPSRLWTELARTHQTWTDLGQPHLHDIGLSATPGRQWIWLDGPGQGWDADL
jgi:protein-L-isoaspartate O-methyltransferase